MNRPRNKEGKFVEYSPLGKRVISVRLPKPDENKLLSFSEKMGISPTELARMAISEWLKANEQLKNG